MQTQYNLAFTENSEYNDDIDTGLMHYLHKFYIIKILNILLKISKKLLKLSDKLVRYIYGCFALGFVAILCIIAISYATETKPDKDMTFTIFMVTLISVCFIAETVLDFFSRKYYVKAIRVSVMVVLGFAVVYMLGYVTIVFHSWYSETIVMFWRIFMSLLKNLVNFSENELQEVIQKMYKTENNRNAVKPYMFYLIGTGLNNEYDISLRTLEILKASKHIFIEYYTSKANINLENLEKMCNNKIIKMYREEIEETNTIINLAKNEDVCLLIIGTPLFATTHTTILNDAKENKIETKIIHNSSIMNVMGSFGLYSYNFGKTVSIPFYQKNVTSFYDKIYENYKNNTHTLCLLDIRVKEVKKEFIFAKEKEYEEERFMTPIEAINQLLYCEKETKKGFILQDTKIIVVSRFGCDNETAYYKTIEELLKIDFGEPLHSIIIPAEMDLVEKENVECFFAQ